MGRLELVIAPDGRVLDLVETDEISALAREIGRIVGTAASEAQAVDRVGARLRERLTTLQAQR